MTRFRVAVTFQGIAGLILLDQIRTLDRTRLIRRLGVSREPELKSALRILREMFAE
jgi:mRNA interferase MazF